MKVDQIIYKAEATSIGGRDGGRAVSSDHVLDLPMSMPKEFGGPGGNGTNPEQLFAAGYASCFLSAIKFVAGKEKIAVSDEMSVTAIVSIGLAEGGFGLAAELKIKIPNLDKEQAESLVQKAHQVCPYSRATRGNIEVTLSIH